MVLKRKTQKKGRPNATGNGFDDNVIDASPDGDGSFKKSNSRQSSKAPANIRETKLWKDSVGGAKGMWGKYAAFIAGAWSSLPRLKQENYILRFSQAITVGATVLLITFFYYFMPTIVRVFLLPLLLLVAWWLGTNVVTPQVLIRFEKHLNSREY